MKRPTTYQELQQAAVQEICLKKEELLERAENLQQLADGLFSITDWATDRLYLNVHNYGDEERLHSLMEIIANWPHIATAPGKGYW